MNYKEETARWFHFLKNICCNFFFFWSTVSFGNIQTNDNGNQLLSLAFTKYFSSDGKNYAYFQLSNLM